MVTDAQATADHIVAVSAKMNEMQHFLRNTETAKAAYKEVATAIITC